MLHKMDFTPASLLVRALILSMALFNVLATSQRKFARVVQIQLLRTSGRAVPHRRQLLSVMSVASYSFPLGNFLSTANSFVKYADCNVDHAADPVVFDTQLLNLLNNLSSHAESAPLRSAYGSTNYTDYIVWYGSPES